MVRVLLVVFHVIPKLGAGLDPLRTAGLVVVGLVEVVAQGGLQSVYPSSFAIDPCTRTRRAIAPTDRQPASLADPALAKIIHRGLVKIFWLRLA